MEALAPLLSALGSLAFAGGVLAWIVFLRRRFSRIEHAWGEFASRRGYELLAHRGMAWFRPGIGEPSRVRGIHANIPFEIELSGHRDYSETQVWAEIEVPKGTAVGAEVPAHAMGEDAKHPWAAIRAQRAGTIVRIWPLRNRSNPRQPGHRVVVAWRGLEQDFAILDHAIATVAALVRHPPVELGPGVAHVPWYMRD